MNHRFFRRQLNSTVDDIDMEDDASRKHYNKPAVLKEDNAINTDINSNDEGYLTSQTKGHQPYTLNKLKNTSTKFNLKDEDRKTVDGSPSKDLHYNVIFDHKNKLSPTEISYKTLKHYINHLRHSKTSINKHGMKPGHTHARKHLHRASGMSRKFIHAIGNAVHNQASRTRNDYKAILNHGKKLYSTKISNTSSKLHDAADFCIEQNNDDFHT